MRLWKSDGRTWTPWAGLSEKRPKTATPFTSQQHHLACNEKGADSVKEPVGLLRHDGKLPDGTTILPWSRSKLLV